MMNSCDKSSAFPLDPHCKAVSYFIFRVCIPFYIFQLHLHKFCSTSQEVKLSPFLIHQFLPKSLVQSNSHQNDFFYSNAQGFSHINATVDLQAAQGHNRRTCRDCCKLHLSKMQSPEGQLTMYQKKQKRYSLSF